MVPSHQSRLFSSPSHNQSPLKNHFTWLILSLLFTLFYSTLGLQKAFSSEYVVQDDAREYVFWMQRFLDSELFPQDLIANYFQSITPLGYATLYKVIAAWGMSPLLFSKILPVFLSIIITIYSFQLSIKIFPIPLAGFLSTLLLNQSLWFKYDVISGTPRAFIYPLFLAFIYYLLQRSWVYIAFIMLIAGLFYPLLLFIILGTLCWRLGSNYRQNYRLLGFFLMLGCLILLPYALSTSEFAPVVTYTQAKLMPEHWTEGRHPFFDSNALKFWLFGQHSGIFPPLMPPIIWLGLLLPWMRQKPSQFPLLAAIKPETKILYQLLIVSLFLFLAAHIFFLKLFFPTRYTIHTFRIIMSLSGGIVLTVLLDNFTRFFAREMRRRGKLHRFSILGIVGICLIFVLFVSPHLFKYFPKTDYRRGENPELYKFLQQQPKDSLIATLADEADNLPTFTQRPILVGREYALPFHLGYYSQIRQRVIDLINATYHPNLTVVQDFIQKYQVKFWLLESGNFQPEYLQQKSWLKSFNPAYGEAIKGLEKGEQSALAKVAEKCTVFTSGRFRLIGTACIHSSQEKSSR
ncbi:hypothetical protein [Calothrix sp. 336/3]|uniref:hypothetical protein n=1 Tax=Calothrix sp. 336/3 TaxID=1337936 RepID=UPI0004E34461|nr:hypothetical protein [Calothrix sp. 336/3]AKG20602.1 hypothetical protein IJ00_04060 [Calothrix sp. 336/3]